jgi:STE24 endopeptidase
MDVSTFYYAVIVLVVGKLLFQLWLDHLNRVEVLKHANGVPQAFQGIIDEPEYKKAVQYTMAKGRFSQFESVYDTAILLLALFSGILPWLYSTVTGRLGPSASAQAAFLFLAGVLLSIPSMPLNWLEQFRLEERFGFNTSTQKTWWLDRLKGLLVTAIIAYPLLILILKIVQWAGQSWWLWAWGVVLIFQLVMLVLAPIVILPLFNKFTPLPEGSLRERLLRLGARTGFKSSTIQVMDGSKRSKHSNAFFTGFGKFRRIILFDTLISQLAEVELEAVLAHEIGHYKKRHIPKMLIASAAGLLLAFFLIAKLAEQPWFYSTFGFHQSSSIAPALLLFSMLSSVVTFWFSPLFNLVSRTFEYQADGYAAQTMQESESLVGALRKLNEKNLSNLTPHRLYSGFYYSHPTLFERERALRAQGSGAQ